MAESASASEPEATLPRNATCTHIWSVVAEMSMSCTSPPSVVRGVPPALHPQLELGGRPLEELQRIALWIQDGRAQLQPTGSCNLYDLQVVVDQVRRPLQTSRTHGTLQRMANKSGP